MADEEVMVEATSPVPSDHHKRKLEDLELNALEPHTEIGSDPNTETVSDSVQKLDGTIEEEAADVDGSEPKRPRLEDKANGLGIFLVSPFLLELTLVTVYIVLVYCILILCIFFLGV